MAYGAVLAEAVKAAEILEQKKIAVDVINARFASPIDGRIIAQFGSQKRIVSVEDHNFACGFGSALVEEAYKKGYSASSVTILGAGSEFTKQAPRQRQLMQWGLNADKIAEKVGKILKKC